MKKKSKDTNWDYDSLTKAIGKIKLNVADASVEHDHYLYGRKKRIAIAKRMAAANRLINQNVTVYEWNKMEKEIEKRYLEGLDGAIIRDILKKNGKI